MMKYRRFIAFFIAFSMMITLLLPVTAAQIEDITLAGNGTAESPYEIGTPDELLFVVERHNAKDPAYWSDNGSKHYRLVDDIDLSGVENFPMFDKFQDVFDGNGKTISNMTITADYPDGIPANEMAGFFKTGNTGMVVKDLIFDNASITLSGTDIGQNSQRAGVVVGYMYNGLISGVTVKNSTLDAYDTFDSAGGIAGAAGSSSVIEDCFFSGTVKAAGSASGIVPMIRAKTSVRNCIAMGDFTAKGIATKSIKGAGGIAVRIFTDGDNAKLENCVMYSGTVSHEGDPVWVGRILALDSGKTSSVTGNLANETVTLNREPAQAGKENGENATEEELQNQTTYEALGWDFDIRWEMDEAAGYPVLKYEASKAPLITTSVLANGSMGIPYREKLTATGVQPISWSLSSGNLPDGLELDTETGEIFGTPTKLGTYTFSVTAENSEGSNIKELFVTIGLVGEGTEDSPYEIGTPDELLFAVERNNAKDPAYWSNNGSKHFKLVNDIDLSQVENFPMFNLFQDVFDGDGYTIRNMTITADYPEGVPESVLVGFIKKSESGMQLKNVIFENASIRVTGADAGENSQRAGVAVGYLYNGQVSGVSVKDSSIDVYDTFDSAGGIAGATGGTAAIEDCFFSGTIKAAGSASGIAPMLRGNTVVRNCFVKGDFAARGVSHMSIRGAAGITVRIFNDGNNVKLENCVVYDGSVAYEGPSSFGGRILGLDTGTGSVVAGNLANINVTVNDSVVEQSTLNGTDMQPEQLQQQSTYEDIGWDFTARWSMDDAGYPVLRYGNAEVPYITTTSLPNGNAHEMYTYTLTADGAEPITWSLESGKLPQGLELDNSTGEISGTPTETGTFPLTVKAENEMGAATKELTLLISISLNGNGTITAPYEIGTPEELLFVVEQHNAKNPDYWSNNGTKYYKLVDDIDLSEVENFPMFNSFQDVFDGNGKTISNMTIRLDYPDGVPTAAMAGFFKTGNTGMMVKDLIFDSASVAITGTDGGTDSQRGGFVVGYLYDGRISGVTVKNSTFDAYDTFDSVGGIAGAAGSSASIENCFVDANLAGAGSASGIVPMLRARASVRNCIAMGDFKAKGVAKKSIKGAGGIAVRIFTDGVGVKLENCVMYDGSVTYEGSPVYAGRILGLDSGSKSSLTGNLANENITVNGSVVTSGTENGIDTTAATLKQQATYQALGWDFTARWEMDQAGYPVLQYDNLEKPFITTASLSSAKLGIAFSQTLSAMGQTPIYWSVESGKLPEGLALNGETGEISGTPTKAGSYSFVICAQNEKGTVSKAFTLTIGLNLAGDGTAENPFEIGTAEQLLFVVERHNAQDPEYRSTNGSKHYKLVDDIDLSKVENFPMFDSFQDVFDGNGKTISNMTITVDYPDGVPASAMAGFFKTGNTGMVVKNLTFEDASVTVTGTDIVTNSQRGGFVVGYLYNGRISGVTVKNSTFDAYDTFDSVGGIAGAAGGTSIIEDCFFSGTVRGAGSASGIVPMIRASATVRNCIAMGTMEAKGVSTMSIRGAAGIVVRIFSDGANAKIQNCVAYDAASNYQGTPVFIGRIFALDSGVDSVIYNNVANDSVLLNGLAAGDGTSDNKNGVGMSLEELQDQSTYVDVLDWDFINAWGWDVENKYPVPQYKNGYTAPEVTMLPGDGTENNPYQISTAAQLDYAARKMNAGISAYVGKSYILTDDITLTDHFRMIDTFTGTLDGQGHIIRQLIIDETAGSSDGYRAGMIRVNYGTVKNLTLQDASVIVQGASDQAVGILVGEAASGSVIAGCMVTGNIMAADCKQAGGLAGILGTEASITNSFYRGDVTAKSAAGGIAAAASGIISNCIAMGNLKANDSAAFITAGLNGASLSANAAYSGTASAAAAGTIYALATQAGQLKNNIAYDGILVDDSTALEHVTKKTLSEMQNAATYKDIAWNFLDNWNWDAQNNYPVPKYSATVTSLSRVTVSMGGNSKTERGFSWYLPEVSEEFTVGETSLEISKTADFQTIVASYTPTPAENGKCQVMAENLEADTQYYYRIMFQVDNISLMDTGSFRTAPESGAFTFLNVSDTDADSLEKLAASAETICTAYDMVPDAGFILHNGDFVGDASSEQNWAALLDGAKPALLNTTIVPVAGEQDGENGEFINHFNLEKINGAKDASGAYYSFDYSNTHFVVLNTNDAGGLSDAQLTWLRNDVQAAKQAGARWTIISLHKGAYLTGAHAYDSDVSEIRSKLVPLMDELGIDLVMQGHDHLYARTKCLKGLSTQIDGLGAPESALEPNFTEIWKGKYVDYTYSGNGTFYFNVGTAGDRGMGTQSVSSEYITKYFERSAEVERMWNTGSVQKFASVTIDNDRLTVYTYQLLDGNGPTMREGFGIDKAVQEMEAQIESLSDAASIQEARTRYNSLTPQQQQQVKNAGRLLEMELEQNPGAATANRWMSQNADSRQAISIRNDTKEAFSNAPVLIRLEQVPSDKLEFYSANGELLPHEIEHFDQNSITSVWVKVPRIDAYSAEMIWVYYGNPNAAYQPNGVWNQDYEVVEHFAAGAADGDVRMDSTGKNAAVVTGAFSTAVDAEGATSAKLQHTKLQYTNVGNDNLEISCSAIVSLTPEDLESMPDSMGGLITKRLTETHPFNTMNMAINKNGPAINVENYGNRNEGLAGEASANHASAGIPADGKPHLVTMWRSGDTVTIFVDGKIKSEAFAVFESPLFFCRDIPLTIGAYSDIDRVAAPFVGTIYEAQVSGNGISEWWEAFKYSNYFGDAVTVGQMESKADNTHALLADIPTKHTVNVEENTLESGLIQVYGAVSFPSELTAAYDGHTVGLGSVSSGAFAVEVPINAIGSQNIILTAKAEDGRTAEYTLSLTLQDTIAPNLPAASAEVADGTLRVGVTPDTEDLEKVNASLYVNESVVLDESNVKVFQGSIDTLTPDTIVPGQSGTVTDEMMPETHVTDGTNPYQLFEISLTPKQQEEEQLHLVWTGETGGREAAAYLYQATDGAWERIGTAGGDGEISIDQVIDTKDFVGSDGKLYLLVLRALTVAPEDRTRLLPDTSQYDATIFWDSDTQVQTEFYPEQFVEQVQWVTNEYQKQKGILQLSTGDVAQFPVLHHEYQWRLADKLYNMYEEGGVPFAISWGNHDQEDGTNQRLLSTKYFPMERFERNAGDWILEGWYDDAPDRQTDSMWYTTEVNGAKLLLITINYYFTSAQLDWASRIIAEHPDHSVIIATHFINNTSDIDTYAAEIMSKLVEPYANVKLALCGHVQGSVLAHREYEDGRIFYSVMKDYQEIPYGAMELLSLLHFDFENDLLYVNTYSPMGHQTQEDPNVSAIGGGKQPETPGLYQYNRDEYVLEIDFGGGQDRTLRTTGLTLGLGAPDKVSETDIAGSDTGFLQVAADTIGAAAEATYEWFVSVIDEAGNAIATLPKLFGFGKDSSDEDWSITLGEITMDADGTITIPYTVGADVAEGTLLSVIAFAVEEEGAVDTPCDDRPVAYNDTFAYDSAGSCVITFQMPKTSSDGIAGLDTTDWLLIQLGGNGMDTVGKKIELTAGADEPGTPDEPITFSASAGKGNVVLSWPGAAEGATAVGLQISLNGDDWQPLSGSSLVTDDALDGAYLNGAISTAATTVEVRGLTEDVTYWFKLVIVGGASAGEYLASAQLTGSDGGGTSGGQGGGSGKPGNWSSLPSGGSVPVIPPSTDNSDDENEESDTQDLPSFMPQSAKDEISAQTPWAAPYIGQLVRIGAIDGTASSFRPNDSVTRAEFVKMLVCVLGLELDYDAASSFSDVSSGDWYAPYIEAAVRAGIVNGLGDGSFGAEQPVTRQDIAAMLYRAAENVLVPGDVSIFLDADAIAGYAKDGVGALVKAGIVSGRGDNTFAPTSNATRAESAKMLAGLYRVMQQEAAKTVG